ncbi:hypothetical protein BJ978_001342 [Agromyces terreus]|uniref:Potassium transporter Trk n=1 Tax=Agromyces terreus TaxID=424795 RepID=A0A9X2H013_9MICO|nr:hypothetical protein [Agromyces terreus]MCP2370666.1 hypothetical protein [Agromyces terreus]
MSNAPTPSDASEPGATPQSAAARPVAPQSAAAEPLTASEPVIETEVTSDTVTVRRAPKFGRFMILGVALGAVVALVLTLAFTPMQSEVDQLGFDGGQVFGFLLLICGSIGLGLGALVALAFDRSMAKRAASVAVEHEAAHRVDESR